MWRFLVVVKRKPNIFGYGEGREQNVLKTGFFELNPEQTWVHDTRAERVKKRQFDFLEPICLRVYYINPSGGVRFFDKWYEAKEPIGLEDLEYIKKELVKREGVDLRLFI